MGYRKSHKEAFIDIEGRKKIPLSYLFNFLCIFSFGLLYIISKYNPKIKIFFTTKRCNLRDANIAVLTNKFNKIEILDIIFYKCDYSPRMSRFINNGVVKVLDTEYARSIYDFIHDQFVIYWYNKQNYNFKEIYLKKLKIYAHEEEIELREKEILFGKNISNLRLPTITEILLGNTFNITNFIDAFCIILWFQIEYKTYGSFVAILKMYSFIFDNYSQIRHKKEMEKSQKQTKIKTLRNGKFRYANSIDLFPGDLVLIEPCKELPADIKLLKGDCITDENFLTGESVPICKSSIQESILYSGTSVLRSIGDSTELPESKYESLYRVKNLIKKDKLENQESLMVYKKTTDFKDFAIGIVVATGFNTARGRILKDIINPKPVKIPFLIEARLYIFYTILLASFFTTFLCFYFHFVLHWKSSQNFIYSADLFFTLASPALHASLSVAVHISNKRLQNDKIKCNNQERIFISGNIDMAIFDKTGTLTCDGLDFLYFDDFNIKHQNVSKLNEITRMALSSCHSVYELDGKYSGDSLDIQMFIMSESQLIMKNPSESTESYRKIIIGNPENIQGPFLKEYSENDDKLFYQNIQGKTSDSNIKNIEKNIIFILRTYDFTSELKRMSVIVENNEKKYFFCKGSPDTIKKLLKNVPEKYDEKVKEHSLCGYRVIAMAYKEINACYLQEECEKNLIFLGLIVFSNKIKSETFDVITELNSANIYSTICTGDNILTAISVARECKIIDESITVIFPVVDEKCKNVYDVEWVCLGDEDLVFDKVRLVLYKNNFDTYCNDFVVACEGKEYEFFYKTHYKDFILEKGRIFARFSPAQKKSLVEDFRNLNKNVLFCGDGANDSGAIGTADVGIALAQNEASLASSFSASNISAVPILIKECRNAYVTSIALFKYVSMSYFLAFVCLMFPVLRNLFLSDFQTLHIDIFIIVPMMFIISNFKKSDKLFIRSPIISLFDSSEFIPFFVTLVLQTLVIFILSFYGPGSNQIVEDSKAGTMIFFVSAFQSIFNGIYLSDAVPHRESIFKNKRILVVSFFFIIINLFLLFINWFDFSFTTKVLSFYLFVEIDNKELGYILLGIVFSVFACFIAPYYTRKLCKTN